MRQTFTATRELICTDGGDCEITICIRYHFTVAPGYEATRTQPAEDATVDVTKIMVCEDGKTWHTAPAIADLAHRVFGEDEAVHEWLLSEACAQAEADLDDAADHKRQLRREDAA